MFTKIEPWDVYNKAWADTIYYKVCDETIVAYKKADKNKSFSFGEVQVLKSKLDQLCLIT